jgi:hypothetical protein
MSKKPTREKTKIWVDKHFKDHPFNKETHQDSQKVDPSQQRLLAETRGKKLFAFAPNQEIPD